MATRKKRPKKTLFYDLFIGEYVEIISKTPIEISEETANGILHQKTPMIFNGYVIDIDDLYIYLGPEPFAISQAIRKDEYISIAVTEKGEESVDNLRKMSEDKDLN